MAFDLPPYRPPDFDSEDLRRAPCVRFRRVRREGVAPEEYHATSVFPEYFRLAGGEWRLLEDSRMDCVVVLGEDGRSLEAREFRRLSVGDRVACGRSEGGEEGILVHTKGFDEAREPGDSHGGEEKFSFRTRMSRETASTVEYDFLTQLLSHERREGFILWVLGPAVVFDRDTRRLFADLVRSGYAHALFGGNALATHDLEGALFNTALGQDLYSRRPVPRGHYRHLDAINRARAHETLEACVRQERVRDGVMKALLDTGVPCLLAGSIRDDGPLPGVITDNCEAQDRMREFTRRATTVIALATQLHTIAVGNMLPSYRVVEGTGVRPVFFYAVDISEFAAGKLADRGSLTARALVTNVQDFVTIIARRLRD